LIKGENIFNIMFTSVIILVNYIYSEFCSGRLFLYSEIK